MNASVRNTSQKPESNWKAIITKPFIRNSLFVISLLLCIAPLIVGLNYLIPFVQKLGDGVISGELSDKCLFWTVKAPISFLIGLLIIINVFIPNRRIFKMQLYLCLMLILLNVFLQYFMLFKNIEASRRAYVKIINNTDNSLTGLQIRGVGFIKDLKDIGNSDSVVFSYYPKYAGFEPEFYFKYNDTVKMETKINGSIIAIRFPKMYMGQSKVFYITKDFKIAEQKDNRR